MTDQKETTTTSPRSGNWKILEFSSDHFAKPVVIDNKHFLVASGDMNKNVYSYDFIQNKLDLLLKYPEKLEPFQVTTCINYNSQKIYLYCNYSASNNNAFMEYDINSKKIKIYKDNLKNTGAHPVLCCLSGTMHLIGGRLNNSHLVWDGSREKFIEHTFRSKMIHGHAVIPIQSTKQILVLGGNDSHLWGGYLDTIWLCDTLPAIKWSLLEQTKMPHKVQNFGYIKTKDESQVLIFGGKTKSGLKDEIWILSLQTLNWTISNVKCPKKGKFYAVKSRDEFVHLFEIDTKNYWKMNLGIILGTTRNKSNSVSISLKSPDSENTQFRFDENNVSDEDNKKDDSKDMDKLKKELIKSKDKTNALIQQNIKLNQDMSTIDKKCNALIKQNVKLNKDMALMDKKHRLELDALKKTLKKYQHRVHKLDKKRSQSTGSALTNENK